MAGRRVVVTGLGVISALGANLPEFRLAIQEGRPGIGPIEGFEPGFLRFPNAAQVRGYDQCSYFDAKRAATIDRFAQFAVIAAREAVADAHVEWNDDLRDRTIIVTGCCVGGQSTEDIGFVELYKNKSGRVHPLTVPKVMSNAGASHISMEFGITGPAWSISTACSSSNHAIGQAFAMIRGGGAEMALTGGSEAPFSAGHLKAWEALRVVSQDTCRPFDLNRRGMVLGEGGAMLILEELDHARRRGARIYGEITGFGMSSDAYHLTQPSEAGPAKAMRAALQDAGLNGTAIGYINAHGTGTPTNDVIESRAIHAVLGEHARQAAVSSTKSLHGHTLGAAGAVEAIATLLALDDCILPPTANFTAPDPECDLDVITNTAREQKVDAAMSNSFAFGGLNAVLVFRRWNGS